MTTEEAAGTATRGTTTVEEAEGVVADTGDVSTNNNKNAYTELPRHVRNGGFGCTIFQIGNAFLKLKKKLSLLPAAVANRKSTRKLDKLQVV